MLLSNSLINPSNLLKYEEILCGAGMRIQIIKFNFGFHFSKQRLYPSFLNVHFKNIHFKNLHFLQMKVMSLHKNKILHNLNLILMNKIFKFENFKF